MPIAWPKNGSSGRSKRRQTCFQDGKLITFDTETGQIRESGGNAAGIAFSGTIKKLGKDRWVTVIEKASMPDGSALGGGILWNFSDDGSEIQVGGQVTIDGQSLDELTDVYTKVDKS